MALIDYNNGTATININGGQAPFSYLLLQDGTAVTYSGVNFQNPIVSSNNSVVFGDSSDTTGSYGLPSGTYTCQITDDLGCVVTTSEIVVGQTQEATTTTEATTTSTTLLQEYLTLTVDQSPVNEGLNVLFTLTSSNIPNNTMVDWAISGNIDSNDISGGLAGSFTMVNNQAQYLATIENDELLEGQEEFTLTLAAIDTNGITAGLSVDVIINDMNTAATTLATTSTTQATTSTTQATTSTTLATTSTTLATTSTTLATTSTTLATTSTTLATTTLPTFDCATAQLSIDDGVVGDGVVFESGGNATGLVPAQYVLGSNTYTATITVPATDAWGTAYSNAGASIECTATAIGTNPTTLATTSTTLATTSTTLATTSTTLAASYDNLTAQTQINEGQVALFTLTGSNIPNGATVGYFLTGISAADLQDPSDMTGTFTMSNNMDQHTIAIANDFLTEGLETMYLELDATDSNGVAAGLTVSVDIIDTSIDPTTPATTSTTLATTSTTLATTSTTLATTSTTLATTSTTLATTTTAAPEDLYWFHTGEATWPYSKDLMSNDPQYFPPDGTNQSNSTPKFKQTFADMLNNPSGYEVVNSTQQFNTGTQLAFDASIGSSYYWILIPDSMGIPDLTQIAGLADTQNNTSDVAHSKMTMDVGGNPYTLYRVNLLSSTSPVTIEYTL